MSTSSVNDVRSSYLKFNNTNCNCGNLAAVRISTSIRHPNRLYQVCASFPRRCSFFQWCEPIGEVPTPTPSRGIQRSQDDALDDKYFEIWDYNHSMDTSSESDEGIFIEFLGLEMLLTDQPKVTRVPEPMRDSKLTGPERVREILEGHVDRVFERFKMERHVFFNLETKMRHRGWLDDTRYIRVDEQLGIFMCLLGRDFKYRDVAEDFQRSPETITRVFKRVLNAFVMLSKENIRPPNFDAIPTEIFTNPKHFPYFKDCIGAIDGTHVHAIVPAEKQVHYRGRKGITTQNVMCACSFDMKFTFVYSGWEGSSDDCIIFRQAITDPALNFPHPPPGKYYVVDSGYPTMTGFMTPFKGNRYHLQDFRGRGREPRNAVELFNHRHSSVRNVIERSFGCLKSRFPILSKMRHGFTLRTQAKIVIACCAIHNFIRDEQVADKKFVEYGNPHWIPEEVTSDPNIPLENTQNEARQMEEQRKTIANELAARARLPLIT